MSLDISSAKDLAILSSAVADYARRMGLGERRSLAYNTEDVVDLWHRIEEAFRDQDRV